jgi:plastocyanin
VRWSTFHADPPVRVRVELEVPVRKLRIMVSFSAVAVVLATALVAPSGAGADDGKGGGDSKRVRILDDCDPATFNAVIGPGTCTGDGETTFADFFAQLKRDGAAEDWEFKPGDFHVNVGDDINAVNKGGEFHTFTRVAEFGGGCVPELNEPLGLTPVAECNDLVDINGQMVPKAFVETGVGVGGNLHVHVLDPGTHKYECLIHPWMRAVVEVRSNGEDHEHHHD